MLAEPGPELGRVVFLRQPVEGERGLARGEAGAEVRARPAGRVGVVVRPVADHRRPPHHRRLPGDLGVDVEQQVPVHPPPRGLEGIDVCARVDVGGAGRGARGRGARVGCSRARLRCAGGSGTGLRGAGLLRAGLRCVAHAPIVPPPTHGVESRWCRGARRPGPLLAKRGPHRAIAGLFGIGNRIFGVLASTAEIQLSFAETPVSALGVESRWCREAVESGAGGVEVRAASGPGIARGGARLWVASTITRTARPTGGRRPCMTAEEAR